MFLYAAIPAFSSLLSLPFGILLAGTWAVGSISPTPNGDTIDSRAVWLKPTTSRSIALPFLRFGAAVAVASDSLVGDELLVGRTGVAARPRSPVGGVHMFRRNRTGRWSEHAVLAPLDLAQDDEFGAALAVDGRLLAVGAPGARAERGAVYLFARTAQGAWVQYAKLVASAGAPGDRFGAALTLRGGLLLVGAPSHATYHGRAVVFRRGAGGRWTEAGTLETGDTSHMGFGQALGLSDGYAFVGAAGLTTFPPTIDQRPKPDAPPRVFVFRDSAGALVPEAQLAPTDSASDFGAALFADGPDLLVSSPSAGPNWRGAVFHFRRERSGRWMQRQRIGADSTKPVTDFGAALARTGRELLVGAPRDRADTGTIFVFRYDTAADRWTQAQRLSPTPSIVSSRYDAPSSRFGETLAAGRDLAVTGLPGVDNFEGAVAILRRDPIGEWRQTETVVDSAWSTRQPHVGRVVPCRHGRTLLFDCQNADLVAYLPLTAIGGGKSILVNGVWGWTDTATGREFALVGRSEATAFVEVTDPVHPKYLGELPLHAGAHPSWWRDMKVYKDYAFIIADDAGPHGMQVFDLTQLRTVKDAPVVFRETAHYDDLTSAHTLAANSETGFLYAAGANDGGKTCGGGVHMIDARVPATPTFAGCITDTVKVQGEAMTYVHETVCVQYRGLDARYRGREICFNSASGVLVIVDVTDKAQPKPLGMATYPNVAFAHQGWLSEDQRYFFLDDEYDETVMRRQVGLARTRTRTIVIDIAKLDDPVVAKEFFGQTAATDHNQYVLGRYLYQANYKAGLRVIDIADPKNPREVGYFDTAPALSNITGFGGAWTNYPYFKSGVVAVTSMDEGLFLIRFRPGPGKTTAVSGVSSSSARINSSHVP